LEHRVGIGSLGALPNAPFGSEFFRLSPSNAGNIIAFVIDPPRVKGERDKERREEKRDSKVGV